jgi:hypothetical protein
MQIIGYGRFIAYQGKYNEAIDEYTLDMGQILKRSDENYEKSLMAKRPASDAGGLVALTYLGQAHA